MVEVVEGDGNGCYVGITGKPPSEVNNLDDDEDTCCRWFLHTGRGTVGWNEVSPGRSWKGGIRKFIITLDPVSRTLSLSSPSFPLSPMVMHLPHNPTNQWYTYYLLWGATTLRITSCFTKEF
jgi:hypothetical protein